MPELLHALAILIACVMFLGVAAVALPPTVLAA
jgi:hypothetical protein